MVLSGTDILGLAAFVLPNLFIRMTSTTLSFAYLREWALLPIILFLLISIAVMYKYRRSQSGINIFSSAVCSMFCIVMLPENPSRIEREGSSDVDI